MLVPLDEERLVGIAERIRASGAEAVAVCFLHAWADSGNEIRARNVLAQRLPGTWFTTSSEVVPEFREYERFSTTVINAYLLPVIDRYVKALGTRLDRAGYRGPVLTMSSAGGVMDLDTARTLPVRTILSGPAGGVAGATWIAGSVALEDFITCDMGGTSTDVCLIESGRPATSTESAFMGYPIKGRQIDINTVGAGGGSIAYVEGGSVLKVGPRSAGADPGPACYGKGGTEPTVTDANVVLGAARGTIRRPGARRVGRGSRHAARECPMAEGIVRLVVAEMANAIREISIERGYDPARFTLVPFGGAGPMHATRIAAELGMRRVLVPLDPGNLSALGLLVSDQRREHVRTFLARSRTSIRCRRRRSASRSVPAARRCRRARRGAGGPLSRSTCATRARASSSPSISPARRASPTTYATRSSNRTRASTGTRMQVATSRSSISEPR